MLGHKPIVFALLLGGLALLIIICAVLLHDRNSSVSMRASGHTYNLTLATTPQAQARGLGGRSAMPSNQGMLFTFSNPGLECFWMKGMRFSLDMIWLNKQKKVVYVQSNVAPSTYPNSFCPTLPAKYVIELDAGQVEAMHLQQGQHISF